MVLALRFRKDSNHRTGLSNVIKTDDLSINAMPPTNYHRDLLVTIQAVLYKWPRSYGSLVQ
jgi:hypothetical protein